MRPTHPQRLNANGLLACMLVCKKWSNSFRLVLWNIVVTSSTGPDFFDPQSQPLLRHILYLETQLPTLGFIHLVSLKICPLKTRGDLKDLNLLWTPIIAIIRTLSTRPISTINLCSDAATVEFWAALASCTRLRTFILKGLTIPPWMFPPFLASVPPSRDPLLAQRDRNR